MKTKKYALEFKKCIQEKIKEGIELDISPTVMAFVLADAQLELMRCAIFNEEEYKMLKGKAIELWKQMKEEEDDILYHCVTASLFTFITTSMIYMSDVGDVELMKEVIEC